MTERLDVEKVEGRPAWEVRRRGVLLGIVWKERGGYRAAAEGTAKWLPRTYGSREEAVEALVRERGAR